MSVGIVLGWISGSINVVAGWVVFLFGVISVVEAASIEGVGPGVWCGPGVVNNIPVLIIGGSGFWRCRRSHGFVVSSVDDRVLGVEVFGFSDVDWGIGFGVSSTLLVVVIYVSAECITLGVWFGSDVVKTFPVLIIQYLFNLLFVSFNFGLYFVFFSEELFFLSLGLILQLLYLHL